MPKTEKILKDGWELHVALRCCQKIPDDIFGVSETFCSDMIMKMRKSRWFRRRFLNKARSIWSFKPYCILYGHGDQTFKYIGKRP